MSTVEKPMIVEVNRYYRPRTFNNKVFSDRGVTIMYTLDYNTHMFTAKWSICQGDNFSKVTGIQYAQSCSYPVVGPITPGMKLNEMLAGRCHELLINELKDDRTRRNILLLVTEIMESL